MSKAHAKTISKPMATQKGSTTGFTSGPLAGMVPPQISPDELKEHIVSHNVCFKNFAFPEAKNLFPNQPALWTCERYYPLTKIGFPVFVDEPMFTDDEAICAKKADFLHKKGVKYLVIKKDTDLQSAMEQLGVA